MAKLRPVARLVFNDADRSLRGGAVGQQGVIPHYFVAQQCPICLEKGAAIQYICPECREDPNQVAKLLSHWISVWDNRLQKFDQACRQCHVGFDLCRSLDCPRMYLRTEAKFEAVEQIQAAEQLLDELF